MGFTSVLALQHPSSTTTPLRLVLIEDCRLVRVGLHSVLDASPNLAVVAEVDSAEEGLPLIRNLKPDVVIIDIGLPGMNGIEAITQLRAEGNDCPIIVLTSHEDEDEVAAAMVAGANAYCLKNKVSSRLVEITQLVNEGSTFIDAPVANVATKLFAQGQAAQNAHQPAQGDAVLACDLATKQVISLRNTKQQPCLSSGQIKQSLSERELAVLALIVEGKSNGEIAGALYISIHTAKFYVSNLLDKLNVDDRVAAAVKAVRLGLV